MKCSTAVQAPRSWLVSPGVNLSLPKNVARVFSSAPVSSYDITRSARELWILHSLQIYSPAATQFPTKHTLHGQSQRQAKNQEELAGHKNLEKNGAPS